MSNTYNIYTITFSELVDSRNSLYFTYKGDSEDISNPKYVAGSCSFQLVNQKSGIGGTQTWQWQTEILQNNVKSYLTGTINTSAGTFLTPQNLWATILKEQQKTLCTLTLDKNTDDSVYNILYVVGRTELVSKLYLYISSKYT
jgi:hypothetical protein